MKPEHEARRKIIREWMSLPKDKRQTEEQAKPFAKKAMERIPSSGDPYRQIMGWLLPRIGKPTLAKMVVRSHHSPLAASHHISCSDAFNAAASTLNAAAPLGSQDH